MTTTSKNGLHILLLSIHGLIRGHDLELGRDADTGGQTKYVLELTRSLALHPAVSGVDLVTRLISDPQVSADYAEPIEELDDKARIIRITAGPNEYLAKEQLWDYLDSFADNTLAFYRSENRLPGLIHSHYADGGYVGSILARQLAIPLVHTGHSLGRVKRRRLLAAGLNSADIEKTYCMSRRIEAEELTLAATDLVITSTSQEIEEQYELYDYYQPQKMQVIPPGTDLSRFHPPQGDERQAPIALELNRFFRQPKKPLILALSRPDARKNIGILVEAFGTSDRLRAMANLMVVAGNRQDITDLDEGARTVITDLLLQMDLYNLYGEMALPKQHGPDEVPQIYRLAAASGGLFVNPALTEPFGLTLIEAAASGLPIVATEDGGPRDIIGNCHNGILVDPLDSAAIAQALLRILDDRELWQRYAENGLEGVKRYYRWQTHTDRYLEVITPLLESVRKVVRPPLTRHPMRHHDRAIFTDLDQNLLGDREARQELIQTLRHHRRSTTFGIATGRRLDSALRLMREHSIPEPDVLITSSGSEIYYYPELTQDTGWTQHIDHQWNPAAIRRIMDTLPGLKLQPKSEQGRFKISYYIDTAQAPSLEEINSLLSLQEQSANVTLSFGQFLDFLPIRASKGQALRYVSSRWDIPLQQVLAAGGSGSDEDMMRGNTLAVVVKNRHHEELSQLVNLESIYFAEHEYARGILEAIRYYDFFDDCRPPDSEIRP
jgi:sucrose-phosphate synthase